VRRDDPNLEYLRVVATALGDTQRGLITLSESRLMLALKFRFVDFISLISRQLRGFRIAPKLRP